MATITTMSKNEMIAAIKTGLRCTEYLTKSKGQDMYNCPFCGSGTGQKGTGAVKYYDDTNSFYCHKCGKKGDVIDLIQIENDCDINEALRIGADRLGLPTETTGRPQRKNADMTDDFKNRRQQYIENFIRWNNSKPENKKLSFVELYDYCYGNYQDGLAKIKFLEEDGNKTFRWLYPDNMSQYGFKWGIGACEKRLYATKDIKNEYNLFLAEGEKDAITASRLFPDVPAVSAPDGATTGNTGSKWKDTYTEQLRDKDIYILYDNDEAGRNFAGLEAVKLYGSAHSVYLLDITTVWNECPEHGDISDMVKALGEAETRKRIDMLIEQAKPYSPEPEPEETSEANRDYLDAFREKIQTEAYKPTETGIPFFDKLMSGGISPQTVMLLMAAPATGKTAFCNQLAVTMAKHQRPVIYLNLEMSVEQMLSRTIAYLYNDNHPTGQAITSMDVLKGYQWQEWQKKAILNEIEQYKKTLHPYLKYENRGSDLKAISEMLTEYGERARATRTQAPAFILDYLHLVSSTQKIETAELIKQVLVTLKQYAVDYNTFVVGIVATRRGEKITMNSGRDTSNIEYTGDYILSLDYRAIDDDTVNPGKTAEVNALQMQNPREMIFRVLKNRHGMTGNSETAYFDTAGGYFYKHNMEQTTQTATKRNRL